VYAALSVDEGMEFHPERSMNMRRRRNYLCRKKEPGLDLRFILGVEDAIEAILEEDPFGWRRFDEDVA